MIEMLEGRIAIRDELMDKGTSYYQAKGLMSIQRIFHISRVQEFDVVQLSELQAELLNKSRENDNC